MSDTADWAQHIERIEELDSQPRMYQPGDATPELIDAMKAALIDLLEVVRGES